MRRSSLRPGPGLATPATPAKPAIPAPAHGIGGRVRGFTLLEAMVVLAVFGVVLAVAIPSMSEFSANNQVAGMRSSFTAAVALARTEAAKRGTPVLIQPRSSGTTGNAYAQGWELVVDADGDGTAGSGEERLRRTEALPHSVTMDGPSPLIFRATGWLDGTSDQVFKVCRTVGASQGYRVTVAPSGVADVASASPCP
jgi:type IV fimbrial biogenesis protein FimT